MAHAPENDITIKRFAKQPRIPAPSALDSQRWAPLRFVGTRTPTVRSVSDVALDVALDRMIDAVLCGR